MSQHNPNRPTLSCAITIDSQLIAFLLKTSPPSLVIVDRDGFTKVVFWIVIFINIFIVNTLTTRNPAVSIVHLGCTFLTEHPSWFCKGLFWLLSWRPLSSWVFKKQQIPSPNSIFPWYRRRAANFFSKDYTAVNKSSRDRIAHVLGNHDQLLYGDNEIDKSGKTWTFEMPNYSMCKTARLLSTSIKPPAC